MNGKTKHSPSRMGSLKFVLLWMGGHLGVWVIGALLIMMMPVLGISFSNFFVPMMLGATGAGVLTGILQQRLVERGTGKSMRGWIPVSIAGWALSGLSMGFFLQVVLQYLIDYDIVVRLMFIPLFLPVAVVQWAWLRQQVANAWLWVLAAVAGSILFVLPLLPEVYSLLFLLFPLGGFAQYIAIGLAALLYSGVTGATMRYLWNQPREKEKRHAALADQDDEADTSRLERLAAETHSERSNPYEAPEALKASRS